MVGVPLADAVDSGMETSNTQVGGVNIVFEGEMTSLGLGTSGWDDGNGSRDLA